MNAVGLLSEDRVLVLAPVGRDAQVTCDLLSRAGFACQPCANMQELGETLPSGTAALLITEEALGPEILKRLLALLDAQEPWSDLPVIVLLSPLEHLPDSPQGMSGMLPGHNVTVLRRPVASATLVSVVNASLRARRRQYELRAHMREREQYADRLEQRVRRRTRRLQRLSDQYEAARDLFFALFQVNPLPIAIVRLEDGLFLDANDAFLTYFALDRDEVVSQRLAALQDRLPLDLDLHILSRLRRFRVVRNLELPITGASEKTRTVLVSAELVTVQNAESALVTFVNITERKEAEETIRELASRLARAEHQERHRIAQILHDDLQQQLYGLQMQLAFVRDGASEEALHELQAIDNAMGDAIKIVRDLSVELSPPILYDEGLVQGIHWIVNRMHDQYGLVANVKAAHSFPIADVGQRVLLFQIVRELLFNAVKHAGVTEVDVLVYEEQGRTRVDVVDRGSGFDPQLLQHDQASTIGRGLRSAQERLRLIGGELEIHSTPGEGTRATIVAPA